jgi:hypothetical protein
MEILERALKTIPGLALAFGVVGLFAVKPRVGTLRRLASVCPHLVSLQNRQFLGP